MKTEGKKKWIRNHTAKDVRIIFGTNQKDLFMDDARKILYIISEAKMIETKTGNCIQAILKFPADSFIWHIFKSEGIRNCAQFIRYTINGKDYYGSPSILFAVRGFQNAYMHVLITPFAKSKEKEYEERYKNRFQDVNLVHNFIYVEKFS